jgi:hypothetical protein
MAARALDGLDLEVGEVHAFLGRASAGGEAYLGARR